MPLVAWRARAIALPRAGMAWRPSPAEVGSQPSTRRPAALSFPMAGHRLPHHSPTSLRRLRTATSTVLQSPPGGVAALGGVQIRCHMGGSAEGTVDAEEVKKFGAFGADWWEPNGPMKPLHSYNKVRFSFLDGMAPHLSLSPGPAAPQERLLGVEGLKVVDVGCGGGIFAEKLCEMGLHVTAIDAAAKNIEVATKHATETGLLSPEKSSEASDASPAAKDKKGSLQYRHMTADALATEVGASFDLVVCSEVIEHVSDVPLMMQHLVSLIKPGGGLLVTTLNRTTLSYALSIVAAERILNLVPSGTHDWSKYVTPDELRNHMAGNGLQVTRLIGAAYNGLSDEWYVVPETSVNYLMFATKPREA